jgi:hypothetical protein
MYFSPLEPPKPTLSWAPGMTASASRNWRSTSCLVVPERSPRGVRFSVSVALRTSAAPRGMNGSLPEAPPPMAV